jgi:CheY-like chemotaxis protein
MSSVARVHLVHPKENEASKLLERLRAAGHEVTYREKADSSMLRELRISPPDAVLVDLSRLPSYGREFAIALRNSKATRHVPLVFSDGDPAKVEAIRQQLPDATYTTSADVIRGLKQAIAHPPAAPAVPPAMMDRYASRTAAQKLGIREGSKVALLDAPRDYSKVLGEMPAGVIFEENGGRDCAVTLWFVHDGDDYRSALPRMKSAAARGKFWVLWRKQKGRAISAVNETLIRENALDFGLVDYKVCSVDATWSALLFAAAQL